MSVAPDGSPVALYALLPARGEGELVARAVRAGGEILELGAGTGRITRQLTELGYRVVAVDQSAEMLAHIEDVETVLADIETLDLGRRFDAVLLSSNLINAESSALRLAFLRACRLHLDEEGLAVIECLPLGWKPPAGDGKLGEVTTRLSGVVVDGDIVRAAVEYATDSGRWRHEFAMRVFDQDALDAALAEAGLRFDRWLDEERTWLVARRG